MKRLFLVSSLACAAVLLSACPDTKLPNPAPRVPEPKAQTATIEGSSERTVPGQPGAGMPAASRP